jgi:bifunctional DNA-binding transcriptional regulator/antitoxin component of YhaV-PrlF toxin-antitoxin module
MELIYNYHYFNPADCEDDMEMTLTAKGQFTLNKGLMEHLGIKPGEKVSITRTPEGINVRAAKNKTSVEEMLAGFEALRGGKTFDPVSIEEMNQAIGECYAEAGVRGLK